MTATVPPARIMPNQTRQAPEMTATVPPARIMPNQTRQALHGPPRLLQPFTAPLDGHGDYTLPRGYLSPTQVSKYRDCPRCFECEYILGQLRPRSAGAIVGMVLHSVIDYMGQIWIDPQQEAAGRNELRDMVVEQLGKALVWCRDNEVEINIGRYESTERMQEAMLRAVPVIMRLFPHLWEERQLTATEQKIEDVGKNPFPFPVTGRIDQVYSQGRMLGDVKTAYSAGGPNSDAVIQLAVYGLFLGGPALAADSLVVRPASSKGVPDVCTYWANGTGIISEDQYRKIYDLVVDTAARISRGDFPIGKGVFGRHDFDHGFPSFSLAIRGFKE